MFYYKNKYLIVFILIFLGILGILGILCCIVKIPQIQVASLKESIKIFKDLNIQNTDPKYLEYLKDIPTLEKMCIDAENAARAVIVQGTGGFFIFLTALVAFLNYQETKRNVTVAEEKQVTERFAKAIEQLGNENIHVRLGAIYALERIAKDSDKDYWQVMEILTAYIRERSPYPPKYPVNNQDDIPPIGTDIQAVLTVISRRSKSYKQGEEHPLDLSKSNLKGANLQKINLKCANLEGVNLTNANLTSANLIGVKFYGADLRNTTLFDADLTNADLYSAYLFYADLTDATLQHAKLQSANLQYAFLKSTDLKNTNLFSVDLEDADIEKANLQGAIGLTPFQVKKAKNWDKAIYNEDFLLQLKLNMP